ncbi:MAG: hypothetical protein M3362_23775 [Acidobacteriota bacterium]|nr:hypothetical protein [Acidobacteriota bacterium]
MSEIFTDHAIQEIEQIAERKALEAIEWQTDLQAFSIAEVMKRLDASEYVIRKMIADGTLEAVRPTEGTVRITARSVRKFLYGDKVAGALSSQSQGDRKR